jgi:hypothetical protein
VGVGILTNKNPSATITSKNFSKILLSFSLLMVNTTPTKEAQIVLLKDLGESDHLVA